MFRSAISSRKPVQRSAIAIVCAAATFLALPSPALASGECHADVVPDGAVNTTDLNAILGAWGTSDPAIDMHDADKVVGCFELEVALGTWGACDTCPADLDDDGQVGTTDLTALLAAWGRVCTSDINQDGNIDQGDVSALQCMWGTSDPLGDLDGDGTVGIGDLIQVLGDFGIDCGPDLDSGGTVESTDLSLLINAWGRCPA